MNRKPKQEAESFRQLLEKKGLKFTSERRQLLEEILKMKGHFDADEFLESVAARGLAISRDTVYRTLPLMLECGVIQKSVGDGRREYFERPGAKGHHDHMVCIGCGKIIEFHSDLLEELQTKICNEYRFQLVFHDHRLFGHCEQCQKTQA